MTSVRLPIELTVRDVDPTDLPELDWSGGPEHINALATALERSYSGELELVLVLAPSGQSVAVGAVDFRKRPGSGELWMLSVLGPWRSVGVGTVLINELENRIRARGIGSATLGVEHDNPRAAALYHRLGYRQIGTELDGWKVSGHRSYATVCFTMAKDLQVR